MIDIENKVFTQIYNAVIEEYPKAFITSVYTNTPESFPCVTVNLTDSYEDGTRRIASRENNIETMVFDINVYSNKANGSKTEVKEILKLIDDKMRLLGFVRRSMYYLQNDNNITISRMFARFSADVDSNGYIYTRR